MGYYIGIDGGGTKTEAAVCGEDGRFPLSSLTGGPSNPSASGFEPAMAQLTALIERVLIQGELENERCAGICLGIAGVYSAGEKEAVHDALMSFQKRRNLSFPVEVRSEVEISLMAALGKPFGIAVISGTGSIAAGFTEDGRSYRAGGWGHVLGDEGSGYRIGQLTLQAAMKSYDGVLPATLLTDAVCRKLGIAQITELKNYIYRPEISKQDIASFAELCQQAADAGDAAARSIVLGQASELAETASALIAKDEAFPGSDIVTIGSIFRHSSLFKQRFREELSLRFGGLAWHEPSLTSAQGAAMLSRKLHAGII